MTDLANAKVLMLAADGFESVELTSPRDALRAAGATVVLAAPDKGPTAITVRSLIALLEGVGR